MTGEKEGGKKQDKKSICTLQNHSPSPAHHVSLAAFLSVSILIKKTKWKGFHANPRSALRDQGGCSEYNLLPLKGTRDRHAGTCPSMVPLQTHPEPPLPGQGATNEDLIAASAFR